MKIKLQGKWEAEKIADILAAIATPWAKDCADRIRRQVEEARTRRCCANCGVAHCDFRNSASDHGKENSRCGAWTRAKDAKEEGEE